LPLLPHSLAAIAIATVDRFALSSRVGGPETGHYFAAFLIASMLTALASALNSAWIPWLYARLARSESSAKTEVVRATYSIYGLLLLGALMMALFARLLVHLVAGSAFAASAGMLVFLAPAAAFSGMYYFVSGYLFYAGRTGVLSAITLSVAVTQTSLIFILIRLDGARGVAIAVLLSSFLYWVLTAFIANRVIPMPWLLHRQKNKCVVESLV
jgi:O-antigen/teichoic acid export membrane protein